MNIPGAYPGEYPILAVWTEGGHIERVLQQALQ
jgi:hypothetical protein